ncbi:MAG: L,D-transpeptidase family protein [Chthoniobacterales bacterium]
MVRSVLGLAILVAASSLSAQTPLQPNVIISVRDQKLMLLTESGKVATYPVSTSKFGLGDNWNSMTTPTGVLQVAQKIGDHAPVGAVFRNRRFTGEILEPNAPGRDPVITRIIWLRGLQAENARAFKRCIYIHGTPEEKTIGRPASYGCIRMKSADVTTVYSQLPLGAIVQITPDRLPKAKRLSKEPAPTAVASAQAKPAILTTNKAAAEPAPKAQTAPLKKSDATAWLRNARA